MRTFLEILLGVGPEYDSDKGSNYSPAHECFRVDGDQDPDDDIKVMPPDLSRTNHVAYLKEKAEDLKAR